MAGAVNLRSGPAITTKRVAQISPKGSRVDVTGAVQAGNELWYAVRYGRYEGYILSTLLRLEEQAPE